MIKINFNKTSYKTAVIVLNWNGLTDTKECLSSIQKYCLSEDYFVVVVDNNSDQKIDSLWENNWKIPIITIMNRINLGFAAGSNVGIKEALSFNTQNILLLNNDTILIDNLIDKMVNVLECNPRVGILGAVNYYNSTVDKVWLAGIRINYKKGVNKSITDYDNTQEELVFVDYVPGSCLMIRANILDEIGYLDENYFAYWEEIDLCFRTKRKGHEVAFLSNSKILHKIGRSSHNALKCYLRTRNKLYFYRKHFTFIHNIRIIFRELLRVALLAFLNLILLKPIVSFGYILGVWDCFLKRMGPQRVRYFLKLSR